VDDRWLYGYWRRDHRNIHRTHAQRRTRAESHRLGRDTHRNHQLEVGKWYSFGVDIWAGENSEIRLSISGTSETFKVNGQWRRCDMDFQATTDKVPQIEMIAGSGSFYADRFSIQHGKGPWTWFCGFGHVPDSAEHFAWEGASFASASVHNGLDRRAGRIVDLDDLFMVSEAMASVWGLSRFVEQTF